MHLNPEFLVASEVRYENGLPVLSWRYEPTDYGRGRFATLDRHIAQDWRTGMTQAAALVGGPLFLAATLLAYLTHQLEFWWDNIHWPLGALLGATLGAWLYVTLRPKTPTPYPISYTLHLRPEIQANVSDPPRFQITLDARPEHPPLEHAAPLDPAGPFDKLASFEVQAPPEGLQTRHQLIANFRHDATTPPRHVLIATWQQGGLEPSAIQTPLHDLRTMLSWALIENRDTWLKPLTQPRTPIG